MPETWTAPAHADLVVAGAGILGLAVALDGVRRGLRVVVVERDARPSGASVRNFGHGCLTAQTGTARAYALEARRRWLELRDDAGLWVQECGTVVVGRTDTELAVLKEFASSHADDAVVLDAAGVRRHVPVAGALGGAFLPRDLRVDPRQAVPALASHLASLGVEFHYGTAALAAEPGVLRTARGDVTGEAIVLALGHDLDLLLPEAAEATGLQRCTLHMLRVAAPWTAPVAPAVLSGTSLLRYSGFLACPSSEDLRAELRPELLAAGVNLMLTQHPSGDLIIGDTHSYDDTPVPFAAEELDHLLLAETARLLGVADLEVRERWRGTYAWAPDREFLTLTPAPGVRAVAITSGIGMTTALGFAPALLDEFLEPQHVAPAS
jgi:FAD dependent oxidoreductase TIGR03364